MPIIFILLFFLSAHAAVIKTSAVGSVAQIKRISDITPVVQQIINSEEFKQRVLKAKFYDTNKSNEEIYKILTSGVWDLRYEFQPQKRDCKGFPPFKRCSPWVLGWTYPNTKTVYFNSLKWDDRDDAGIAGTVCHEESHKKGFIHSFNWTKTREMSVPYSVGTICAEMYGKYSRQ